jgi:hypothetical protein
MSCAQILQLVDVIMILAKSFQAQGGWMPPGESDAAA